ncbi:MAG: DUF2189 domain-containing protein [Sphingomonas sp.]
MVPIAPAAPGAPAKSLLQAPIVRDISRADLFWALRKGWSDFLEKRGDIILLIVLYPVLMLVVAAVTLGNGLFPLLLPLVAGLSLLGPIVAVGFYELARRREEGRDANWAHFLDPFRGPSGGQIAALGAFLCLIFLAWVGVAWAIYQVTLGTLQPDDASIFLRQLFTTPEGWALILFGNIAGFAFAAVTLITTLVSFPLLVDRPVDLTVAVQASLRAVRRNPVEIATWGLIVVVLLARWPVSRYSSAWQRHCRCSAMRAGIFIPGWSIAGFRARPSQLFVQRVMMPVPIIRRFPSSGGKHPPRPINSRQIRALSASLAFGAFAFAGNSPKDALPSPREGQLVYSNAVLAHAKRYRFKNIGGTSATLTVSSILR